MGEEQFQIGKKYTKNEILAIKGSSYIPTDHCYNRYCFGGAWANGKPGKSILFEYIKENKDGQDITYFKYLGPNAQYSGQVMDCRKETKGEIYGYWDDGIFTKNTNNPLIDLIINYEKYKNSSEYDEQYKYDYFAQNSNIFNDLNNLSEKFFQLGSPNFAPYVWKSSMFRHLTLKHTLEFSQILNALFYEESNINDRILAFRKGIKDILLNDSEWNNKNMVDPSVESASFFLSLKYPDKYLLFTRIKPYTSFSKNLNLGLDKLGNEARYIAWIDYCKNELLPEMDKVLNKKHTLLDAQDFIWFIGKTKIIENKENEDEKMQLNISLCA